MTMSIAYQVLQPSDDRASQVLIDSSASNIAIWISVASFAAVCVTLIVQRIEYRLSGPVVEVTMTLRWNYADGYSRPLLEDVTLREEDMFSVDKLTCPGWVIAVEVRNRGRSPTSILSWYLRRTDMPLYQPALPHNPRLPAYLRPGEMHVFLVAPESMIQEHPDQVEIIKAVVTVIKGRKDKEYWSDALKVPKPDPPLPGRLRYPMQFS